VRIAFSMSILVRGSTWASTQPPPLGDVVCLNTETRTPSARRSRSRMVTCTFMRSLGVSVGVYQSVMITPPNGSAEASGMKLMVGGGPPPRVGIPRHPGAVVLLLVVRPGAEQPTGTKQAAFLAIAAGQALIDIVLGVAPGAVAAVILKTGVPAPAAGGEN